MTTVRKDTEVNVHAKFQATKVLLKNEEEEFYFYLSSNNVVLPPEVVDHYLNKTITDEIIQSWFSTKCPWEGFGAEDEIRSEIIRIYGESKLSKVFNFKVIDKISGVELYKNYPVYGYYQQGDTLHFPDESWDVEVKDVDSFLNNYPIPLSDEIKANFKLDVDRMNVRLQSNIFYELLEGEYKESVSNLKIKIRCLKMGNASLYAGHEEIHIEPVDTKIKNVFEAIIYRNSIISGRNVKGLPILLS